MNRSQHNPFSAYHPVVALTYLVCAAGFAMAAMQPVYAGLSLAGALVCAVCVRGAESLRHMAWLAVLVLVVTVANMLFVSEGATTLFTLGSRAFTLEALLYGLCSGIMLAAVFLWMASYAACMDSAATTELLGRAMPTVSLMISQVMRLVPQFARRGRTVAAALAATPAAAPRGARERTAGSLRTVSVLMGWGLEDSLVRADSMRARGYACGATRTTYRRCRMRSADAVLLAIVIVLAAVNIPLVALACSQYSFYPTLPRLVAWWGYLPYAALMLLPAALALREWWLWRA